MNEFLKNLGSEYWWVSVVAVSVALNLASSFLFKYLETSPGRALDWWRSQSERRKKAFTEEVQALSVSPSFVPLYLQQEMRDRNRAVLYSVLAVFVLILATTARVEGATGTGIWFRNFLYLFVGVLLLLCMRSYLAAMRTGQVVDEAVDASLEKPVDG